jgi:hypothetical protein
MSRIAVDLAADVLGPGPVQQVVEPRLRQADRRLGNPVSCLASKKGRFRRCRDDLLINISTDSK